MISLPPELEAFAHQQIESGKYSSIEEVLADGVRALIDREDIIPGTHRRTPTRSTNRH
jgi:putative addiction module CopG family antidote